MKRRSLLILIAVLLLAVSIPLFSLAQSETAVPPADGIVVDETQLNADDIIIGEDGYCYTLDENGAAQCLYARGMGGRYMALQNVDGAYCWAWAGDDDTAFQTRRNSFGNGRGCPRWN
ncbi:MAG: hypothetical protein ABIG45_08320 [Bacillota bacterium]